VLVAEHLDLDVIEWVSSSARNISSTSMDSVPLTGSPASGADIADMRTGTANRLS
jgi:hypothetical protein